MTEAEVMELLRNSFGTYNSTPLGPSYVDQFRNYGVARDALNNAGVKDPATLNKANAVLGNYLTDSVMGAGLTTLNGVTGIFNAAKENASVADTTDLYNRFNDIRSREYGFQSEEDIVENHARNSRIIPRYNFDTFSGTDTWGKIKNTAGSTLTGATTGFQLGGPWGAAIGAGVGLLAGAGSWAMGDYNAKLSEINTGKAERVARNDAAVINNTLTQNYQNKSFADKVYNSSSDGGAIVRKKETIQDFAAKILKRSQNNDVTKSSGLIRKHCKGGTMIRIKTK